MIMFTSGLLWKTVLLLITIICVHSLSSPHFSFLFMFDFFPSCLLIPPAQLKHLFFPHAGIILCPNRSFIPPQKWKVSQTKIRVFSTLLFILFGCLIFVALPAVIFKHIEGWSTLESIYFVVITLTTIGFGDFVAGEKGKMIYSVRFELQTILQLRLHQNKSVSHLVKSRNLFIITKKWMFLSSLRHPQKDESKATGCLASKEWRGSPGIWPPLGCCHGHLGH